MKCEGCNRDAVVYVKGNGNSYSEMFYTRSIDRKMVCIECLGIVPKSLKELNDERRLHDRGIAAKCRESK